MRYKRTFRARDYNLARCADCGQNFCSPEPTAAEIATFYEGDYHSELRDDGATEREFGPKFRSYRDWALKFVTRGRSLDIGTATGLFPSLLKQVGFDAEGLEFNEASARWGEWHYGVRIRTCGLEEIEGESGSYDLVSMTDVLEHTEHPLRFLSKVRELLRPGGFVLVTFPDISALESRYGRFLSIALRRGWLWYSCHIPLHTWEFTPRTALVMFDKAGFEVVDYRRRQEHPANSDGALLGVLFSPVRVLSILPLGQLFGTQMEFILRRRG